MSTSEMGPMLRTMMSTSITAGGPVINPRVKPIKVINLTAMDFVDLSAVNPSGGQGAK